MSPNLQSWLDQGKLITLGASNHSVFVLQKGDPNASPEKTLLLLHGFPESSFSYHQVVDGMLQHFDHVVLFDMLGYGLSDKPINGYTYSMMEQADLALQIWQHCNITGGHLLAHDMGDSVATELLTRHTYGLMPAWFDKGLQSITFTNGGMILEEAKLRIIQKLLLSKYGYLLNKIMSYKIFRNQVISAHGNKNLPELEIAQLWQVLLLKDGNLKTYLTIRYLSDRRRFERARWLPALASTSLPIHICWGADDAVAPVAMAYRLKKQFCPNGVLTIMKGMGHFAQLENPDKWVTSVLGFYKNL